MATRLPLHAITLAEAGSKHEEWAIGLLDLCDSFEEARRMLVTKSTTWRKALLHLAVQSDLRALCSNVQCQTLCDEWLSGNDNFDSVSVVLNRSASLPRIVLHMLLPVDVPGFEPIIVWRAPFSMEGTDVTALGTPPRLSFYQIPQVKSLVRFTMHVSYTCLISYATMETPMTWLDEMEAAGPGRHAEFSDVKQSFGHAGGGLETRVMDITLFVWTFALVLDELYKYVQFPSTFQVAAQGLKPQDDR